METTTHHFQQDAAAVLAVRGGDVERYRELVERHERQVFAVAWSRLGNATLAEEATQETFIRGFQKLFQLADGAKFSGWISALARNIATDLGLKHRRELDKCQRWAMEQSPPEILAETPGDPEEATQETMRQALAALSTEHRECLVLFYVEGKSGTATAAALGIAAPALRMRLLRARRALRAKLDEQLISSLRALRPANLLVPAIMTGVLAAAAPAAKAAGVIGTTVAVAKSTSNAFALFFKTALPILMTKTQSSLTLVAVLLLLCGSSFVMVHHGNQQAGARLATLTAETARQQALSTARERRSAAKSVPEQLAASKEGSNLAEIIAKFQKLTTLHGNDSYLISLTLERLAAKDADELSNPMEAADYFGNDSAAIKKFMESLAGMDADALKNLIAEVEKINNPPIAMIDAILKAMIKKDPGEATRMAALRFTSGKGEPDFLMMRCANKAYEAWIEADPAAAASWYAAAEVDGSLQPKGIVPERYGDEAIERAFARLTFNSLLRRDPVAAETMLAKMQEEDVINVMRRVKDPALVERFLPLLPEKTRIESAEGAAKALAAKDYQAAVKWASSLGLTDAQRDSLLATAVLSARANGTLDLAAVGEITKNLQLEPERRDTMLRDIAMHGLITAGEKDKYITIDKAAIPSRLDWVRQQLPPEEGSIQVGKILADLSIYGSYLYLDVEMNRHPEGDPKVAASFVRNFLARFSSGDKYWASQMESIIEKHVPPGPERDEIRRYVADYLK